MPTGCQVVHQVPVQSCQLHFACFVLGPKPTRNVAKRLSYMISNCCRSATSFALCCKLSAVGSLKSHMTCALNDGRLNAAVFGKRLPDSLKISWNTHLNTTAGLTYSSRVTVAGDAPRQVSKRGVQQPLGWPCPAVHVWLLMSHGSICISWASQHGSVLCMFGF